MNSSSLSSLRERLTFSGGTRFALAFISAFLLTAVILASAGYGVTRFTLPPAPEMFRAPAFEFALAHGWWCELEEGTYTCSPPGKPPYSAIAVIAIKESNEHDNLKAYEGHLKKMGEQSLDTSFMVKRRALGGREWVEAFRIGSEIPNYNTYYLATNTSFFGVLVTMSVHKDYARQYISELNKMISTLNIYQR